MHIIRDHPDWGGGGMTLDGVGSYVSVRSSLKIFHEHNILIVKEEADTSLLNQSYNQHVAICDKINVWSFLDLILQRLPVICQWTLIVVCITGFLTTGSTNAWITSFKLVNLHPHLCMPFED
jgi:hypothetical protein